MYTTREKSREKVEHTVVTTSVQTGHGYLAGEIKDDYYLFSFHSCYNMNFKNNNMYWL